MGRSQQKILIFPTSQRHWMTASQRSRQRILNFLRNSQNQQKLKSQLKKHRNHKSQRFFSRRWCQGLLEAWLKYDELRWLEEGRTFLTFAVKYHLRNNVSFPCKVNSLIDLALFGLSKISIAAKKK